jgi:hypothetical protein
MKAEELAFVQGWADTRLTLRRWKRRPARIMRSWAAGSLAVALLLLTATWVVALVVQADPTGWSYPGLTEPATTGDFGYVLLRNFLVLALHSLACVAGFIAGSALPVVAGDKRGLWRKIHEKAGPLAIGFVVCATTFSLCTQAYALGHECADLAALVHLTPLVLLLTLTPHAVPELFALFLPLAAWMLASRRGAWNELLAATFVTTAIAIPLVVLAAATETWITPHLVHAVAF